MELPSHPEADDSAPDHATTGSWVTWLVVAVVVAVIAVIVILHLAGVVGPAAN